MLVVSPKRLVPVQINTTVLQGEDGNYYYLHRDLYDQLVVLADAYDYGARMDLLIKSLTGEDRALPDNVKNFFDTVPLPVKMAAPYLLLVNGVEQLETIEDMCGALTVISMSINLRRILKVDKSIRAAVTFSLHIREEYRTHWDRFFQENPEFGTAVTLPPPPPANAFIPTPEGTTIVHDNTTGEEKEVQYTTPIADFDFDSLLSGIVAEEVQDQAAAKTPAASAGMAGSVTSPNAPKVQSGMDLFAGI